MQPTNVLLCVISSSQAPEALQLWPWFYDDTTTSAAFKELSLALTVMGRQGPYLVPQEGGRHHMKQGAVRGLAADINPSRAWQVGPNGLSPPSTVQA